MSATVIDELVTILGIDIGPGVMPKLQKFNTMIGSVTRYVGWASAGIMAAASSITFLTERMTRSSAELAKYGTLTGQGAAGVQAMGFAAEMAGGSFDAMMQDMLSLTKNMSSPIPGEFNHGLFMLGIGVRKASGELKSADEVMMDIADKFKGMSATTQLQWASRIGINDDTLMLLRLGRTEIERLRQQAKDIPTIVDEKSLKNAQEFVIQLGMVRRILTYIGQSATSVAGPALKGIVKDFTEWLKMNREFIQMGIKALVDGIVEGFKRFHGVMRDLLDWVSKTFPALSEFAKKLDWVSVISGTVFGSLMVLAGMFLLLYGKALLVAAGIAAAGLAVEDFVVYLRGGESATGSFIDKIKGLRSSLEKDIPGIVGLLKNLSRGFKDLGKAVWDALVYELKAGLDVLLFVGRGIEQITGAIVTLIDKVLLLAGFNANGWSLGQMGNLDDVGTAGVNPGGSMFSKMSPNNWETYAKPTAPPKANWPEHSNNKPTTTTIQINQTITGNNAPAIASESARKIDHTLQQMFPGGVAPVTN